MADEQVPQDQAPEQTVNLVNPDGNLVSVGASQAQDALTRYNYRTPTQTDLQNYQDKQEYSSGAGNALKAFGAGALRAGSFGLSDEFLVHKMGVQPSTLDNLRKYQSTATGAGEIAGIGGSLLLAPEAEGVAAAKAALSLAEAGGVASDITAAKMALTAARSAPEATALTAADAINPVSAIGKIGQGITQAFTPEASSLAGQIAAKAVGGALGSGVEGAAYGLGQSVSEDALGDPNAFGEKLLANVTHGAILGGALGGALHGAMAPFLKEELSSSLDAIAPKIQKESITESLEGSEFSAKEKASYLDGLKELKDDTPEIKQAAEDLGVNSYPGQVSASGHVQKVYGTAIQSPYFPGVKEKTLIDHDFKKVSQAVDSTLGESTTLSEKELGDSLKSGLIGRVEKDIAPLNEAYAELKPYREAIPISEKATSSVGNNILKDKSLVGSTGAPLNATGPEWQLASNVAAKLKSGELATVDDLTRYQTTLRREFGATPETRHILGVIQDKLDGLHDRWIQETADQMKTPEAKAKFADFRAKEIETNRQYSGFKKDVGGLGGGIGFKNPKGAQDMIRFLNDIPGSTLGSRITRDKPEFIQMLQDRFPEQFEQIKNFQKTEIRNGSYTRLDTGTVLNPEKVLKQIDKLSKETKNAYFSPEEIKTLQSANKWLSAWGGKVGPSWYSSRHGLLELHPHT